MCEYSLGKTAVMGTGVGTKDYREGNFPVACRA
jgi:hypothetical protein